MDCGKAEKQRKMLAELDRCYHRLFDGGSYTVDEIDEQLGYDSYPDPSNTYMVHKPNGYITLTIRAHDPNFNVDGE